MPRTGGQDTRTCKSGRQAVPLHSGRPLRTKVLEGLASVP